MLDRASMVGGKDAPGEMLAWHVEGMDCASCVAKVRTAVERLPGVSGVEVNLMAERLILHRMAGSASPAAVEKEVGALGYRPTRLATTSTPAHEHARDGEADDRGEDHHGHTHVVTGAHAGHLHAHSEAEEAEERAGLPWWRTTKAYLAASLGGLVAAAWVLSYLFPREAYWIYLAATLAALFPFGRRALAVARAGTPFSIETLMCLAALGAVVIGAAEEAAVVVLLFAVGELLENVAAGQA